MSGASSLGSFDGFGQGKPKSSLNGGMLGKLDSVKESKF